MQEVMYPFYNCPIETSQSCQERINKVILGVYMSLLIVQVGQLNNSSISDLNYYIENLNLTNTEKFITNVAHQKEDLIHRF